LLNNGGDDPPDGFFDIVLEHQTRCGQRYLQNTAVLTTTLYDDHGGAIETIDFAPRFRRLGRMFRPTLLVRIVRALFGRPCITIRLRPTHNYGAARPQATRGSNHIRYISPDLTLRCTTTGPVTFLQDEISFILDDPVTMLLGADEPLASPIVDTGRDFLEQTVDYWTSWSRFLSIPFEWQKAVIRAAITLKLCNFEESGAIFAALTTSIPEAPDSRRNWDYRYCWLRDGYFVVQALNRLDATRTMEGYIQYVTNIVARTDSDHLQPVDDTNIAVMSCQHAMPQGRYAGHNAAADLLEEPLLTYRQPTYVTCLGLGPKNAIYTEGWDRVVRDTNAHQLKRDILTQWIYPPLSSDRTEILAAAEPVTLDYY
jgi:hypothetical protein